MPPAATHRSTQAASRPLTSASWAWLGTALGAGFADAELLSHGDSGDSFKAEVLLVAVASPHLLLLGAGYAGVAAQVDSFVESGLYTTHACRLGDVDCALFVYFLCRRAPQGSTPRRGDPGRRISDHGAPRRDVEADGDLVLSTNVLSGAGRRERRVGDTRWPLEVKPLQ